LYAASARDDAGRRTRGSLPSRSLMRSGERVHAPGRRQLACGRDFAFSIAFDDEGVRVGVGAKGTLSSSDRAAVGEPASPLVGARGPVIARHVGGGRRGAAVTARLLPLEPGSSALRGRRHQVRDAIPGGPSSAPSTP
jgi:hypothetical protein